MLTRWKFGSEIVQFLKMVGKKQIYGLSQLCHPMDAGSSGKALHGMVDKSPQDVVVVDRSRKNLLDVTSPSFQPLRNDCTVTDVPDFVQHFTQPNLVRYLVPKPPHPSTSSCRMHSPEIVEVIPPKMDSLPIPSVIYQEKAAPL